ncbi:MAG: phytoene desaturase [Candidatus Omnitrophica bacterium]|nr:phytoene desaturase [Candidatus Omnitrophota bacterium]
MNKNIAVVGAGVGGMAVAARLASKGFNVDVYEKLPREGGRVHIIEDKGFKFDTGPSFILMRDFFDEVFTFCGKDINDYLNLRTLDQSYKIFFADGETLNFYRDLNETKKELERIEKGAASRFDAFLKSTGKLYDLFCPYLYRYFTVSSLFKPSLWPLFCRFNPFETIWQLSTKFFKSDKIRYAVTFQAMFLGVSPFDAPSFYSMISYADHALKIYHPLGGMYELARALKKLGSEFGVTFHFNTPVHHIEQNERKWAAAFDHTSRKFDQIVINADYVYAQERLLKRKYRRSLLHSCSAYLIYLGLKQKICNLDHHNLFFSSDPKNNLEEIFQTGQLSEEPSFYVHLPTHVDPCLAPADKDIMYILVPVANMKYQKAAPEVYEHQIKSKVFKRLSKIIGQPLHELIECEYCFYPKDFQERYNLPYGSAFGLAHTLSQSAFFRPPNQDSQFRNLYYVGASTQPGGGLPPVLAGSRIVADLINKK